MLDPGRLSRRRSRKRAALSGIVVAVLTAGLAVTDIIPAGAAGASGSLTLPNWPDNPNWQQYVLGTGTSTVSPVVVTAANAVDNPQALAGGSGATTLTMTQGGLAPSVLLDYGKDVGGTPYLQVESVSPAPGQNSVSVHLAFSESRAFMYNAAGSPTGEGGGQSGARQVNLTINAGGTITTATQGGERFESISLNGPGSIELAAAGIQVTGYLPAADQYQGNFVSSSDALNRMWYDGTYTTQLDISTAGQPSTPNFTVAGPAVLDGAKRDRQIWSGDIAVEGPTLLESLGENASPFLKPSLQYLIDHQRANGELTGTSVFGGVAYSTSYSIAAAQAIIAYWRYTGDETFIQAAVPALNKEMTYLQSLTDSRGLLVTSGLDWDLYDGSKSGAVTYWNALYYSLLVEMAYVADHVGTGTPSDTYVATAASLKAEINAVLLQNGVYVLSDRVTNVIPEDGNSAAVVYGIAPPSARATILNALKDQLWTPYGPLPFSPTSSFAHTLSPYVAGAELNARFAAGDTTDAFTLLQNVWGPMIDRSGPYYSGAFWENLKQDGTISSSGISLAHGWSATPTSALTEYVLGVQPLDPGYSTWQVKPQPGDLSWDEGQVPTAGGRMSVRWAQDTDAGTFHMQVVSPSGTGGEVWVPLASSANSLSLPLTPGTTFVRRAGNYDVYRVGAGTFEFSSAPVTFTSLEQLVAFFSVDPAVTSGLNDKLNAAAAAESARVRDFQLDAFVNQVNAQTGKALTPDRAQVLTTLAAALR